MVDGGTLGTWPDTTSRIPLNPRQTRAANSAQKRALPAFHLLPFLILDNSNGAYAVRHGEQRRAHGVFVQGGGARYPYPKEVWSPAGVCASEMNRRRADDLQVAGGPGRPTGKPTLLSLSQAFSP